MDVCEEDLDRATGKEEVGYFDHRYEVGAVWPSCCRRPYSHCESVTAIFSDIGLTPVNNQRPFLFLDHILNYF